MTTLTIQCWAVSYTKFYVPIKSPMATSTPNIIPDEGTTTNKKHVIPNKNAATTR